MSERKKILYYRDVLYLEMGEIIEIYNEIRDSLDDELKDDISLEVDYEDSYGDIIPTLNLGYYRYETDEQIRVREQKERNATKMQEDAELAQLKRLQEKYKDVL